MDSAAVRQLGMDVIERESAAVASVAGQLDETFVQAVQALLAGVNVWLLAAALLVGGAVAVWWWRTRHHHDEHTP